MKTAKTALVFLSAIGLVALEGCASESTSNGESVGAVNARLHRAKDCNDLNLQLQADALAKLNKLVDQQIGAIKKYGWNNYGYGGYGVDDSYANAGASKSTSAPEAASDSAASASGSGQRATSHSETTIQVKGVDEADIVKTDGKNIFLLHGNKLEVVNAWPKEALAERGSKEIEGQPSEMYVDSDPTSGDAKIVVYSEGNGYSVYKAAGVTPKDSYGDVYFGGGYGGGVARGAADDSVSSSAGAAGAPTKEIAPTPAEDAGPPPETDAGTSEDGGATDAAPDPDPVPPVKPVPNDPWAPLTKVTVLTFHGADASISVDQEMYFEGNYLDSRKVGSQVRTVLNGGGHGPTLDFSWSGSYPTTADEAIAALEEVRARNTKIIQATTSDTWVPYSFTKKGDAVTANTTACEDYYTPDAGTTQYGLTQIESFDLAAPANAPRGTAVVGAANTVYATADSMYVAGQAWLENPIYAVSGVAEVDAVPPTASSGGASSAGSSGSAGETKPASLGLRDSKTPIVLTPISTTRTHIHKFEFASDPTFANYVASGSIAGAVKDQYSLDDQSGFLRVATTDYLAYVDNEGQGYWTNSQPRSVNHVLVLQQQGEGLQEVGNVGDLAPDEQIYSTRFIGNRGYVVTYRQVDPLFTLDLSDPKKPRVVAALKIPGFSEFMQPIDDNHILTIGRDGTDTGRQLGLALKIFDVTDLANPKVSQQFSYSAKDYGQSDAEWDPKAFTYFGEKKLLAFPYVSYSNTGTQSSLEIFSVDTAAGFTKLGSIDHSPFYAKSPYGYCGGYFTPQVRRGVFLEDVAYSISYGGIVAKKVSELAGAGVSLALPTPNYSYGYGYAYADVCYATDDVAMK